MNIVTVKINDNEYNLKGDENSEYLQKVSAYVDKKIRDIKDKNNKLSLSDAAVLTAANITDDMFKREEKYREILDKYEKIHEDYKRLVEENKSLEQVNNKLKENNDGLNKRVLNLQNKNCTNNLETQVRDLNEEMSIMEESTKKYIEESNMLKSANKELKFNLQTYKYKVLDLENKLQENQIKLVKEMQTKEIEKKDPFKIKHK